MLKFTVDSHYSWIIYLSFCLLTKICLAADPINTCHAIIHGYERSGEILSHLTCRSSDEAIPSFFSPSNDKRVLFVDYLVPCFHILGLFVGDFVV